MKMRVLFSLSFAVAMFVVGLSGRESTATAQTACMSACLQEYSDCLNQPRPSVGCEDAYNICIEGCGVSSAMGGR